MSSPFIGEILMFGGNFAVRNWALCQGQLLPIAQNSALFSILGTTYGGDGRVTFALPDFRGRVAIQQGNGPGLPNYSLGQRGGSYQISQTASHTHSFNVAASSANADTAEPSGASPARSAADTYSSTSDTSLAAGTTGSTGIPSVNIMPPYLGVNFLIALFGTFPSRN